jgi:hypothetical protein
MQMQQTQAADSAAAKSAQYRSSAVGDASAYDDSSSDSPLAVVMQYFSDATEYTADMMQDLFAHAEAR